MNSAADRFRQCVSYLEQHCNPTGSIPYRTPDYLYALVLWTYAECIAAKTILEVGIGPDSCSGITFAHAMGPGGVLWSVDIEPTLPKAEHVETAERLGVTWRRVYGDSLSDTVQLPPPPFNVDLLYIDGNHDAAHAEGDLRKFWPYLRPGGYLLIDDFPPQYGVGEGRAGIERQLPYQLHMAHEPPHGNGRLVCQKPLHGWVAARVDRQHEGRDDDDTTPSTHRLDQA